MQFSLNHNHLFQFGYAVPAWEWLVFVANHARSESGQWRDNFKQAPFIVRQIMKNGKNIRHSHSHYHSDINHIMQRSFSHRS